MNKDDKDILSGIADTYTEEDTISEDDDILINGLFAPKKNTAAADSAKDTAPKAPGSSGKVPAPVKVSTADSKKPAVQKPAAQKAVPQKKLRNDARYTMTTAEIETLASAAEDAVADGRFGAALDSVFFTAGPAREALRDKLNIRIPIGSADTDLPVIAAAALIESYLEYEDINGDDIEEKLRLIIESSEDENRVRPSEEQVNLRVFECALILCVQTEQCGKHPEIKNRLYGSADSFLRKFLDENLDQVLQKHRKEIRTFSGSVKLQSNEVSFILEEHMAASKNFAPFPVRFFAQTKPVLITAVTAGVLCLASIIIYIVTYGSIMSFIATDNFLMSLVITLELLFCGGLMGISWLVYMGGEYKDTKTKEHRGTDTQAAPENR